MSSSFRNLTEPLIETPRERRAPDCIGMNVRLDGPGTTDGLADSFAGAAGSVFRVNMCFRDSSRFGRVESLSLSARNDRRKRGGYCELARRTPIQNFEEGKNLRGDLNE